MKHFFVKKTEYIFFSIIFGLDYCFCCYKWRPRIWELCLLGYECEDLHWIGIHASIHWFCSMFQKSMDRYPRMMKKHQIIRGWWIGPFPNFPWSLWFVSCFLVSNSFLLFCFSICWDLHVALWPMNFMILGCATFILTSKKIGNTTNPMAILTQISTPVGL